MKANRYIPARPGYTLRRRVRGQTGILRPWAEQHVLKPRQQMTAAGIERRPIIEPFPDNGPTAVNGEAEAELVPTAASEAVNFTTCGQREPPPEPDPSLKNAGAEPDLDPVSSSQGDPKGDALR